MKVPEFILEKAFSKGMSGDIILPVGSFVKPIDHYWLPRHIFDTDDYRFFDPVTEVYCYTAIGLIPIPKRIIRKLP